MVRIKVKFVGIISVFWRDRLLKNIFISAKNEKTSQRYAKYVVKQHMVSANHTTYCALACRVDIVSFAVINKSESK